MEYKIGAGVRGFSTTRQGGVSTGNYGTFNINEYCGDDAGCIAENRRLLAQRTGVAEDHIILPHQTHGTEVRPITAQYFQMPEEQKKAWLEGVDAIMTDQSDICIGVSTADCIPILLYDPEHHAAAAIHAGWRGTVARIAMKAVGAMKQNYGTRGEDLKAVIGPGISRASFEVGDEVYEAFQQAGFPMGEIAERMGKWHIDLPLCNRLQLEETGVKGENIYQTDICTYQRSDEYFSARKLGIRSGRIYTAIILT